MRVVVYQDYLRSGGTEAQSLFLCDQFLSKGDDVSLLTNRPGGKLSSYLNVSVPWMSLQKSDTGLNWYCPSLFKYLNSRNPDIVILMGRNANCQGARLMRKFPNVRFLSTFRTGRKLPLSYQKTLKKAPLVVCNSEASVGRLKEMGIAPKSLEVHPNACLRACELTDLSKFMPDGLVEDFVPSHRLLYTAAMVKGKNHVGALRMMKRICGGYPDAILYLLGDGPEFGKIQLKINQEGMTRNVKLMGYRRDLQHFLSISDIVISPSLEESMPNALVEAQYAGLPIVAFDESGVSECFEDGVSGILIERNNEDQFIDSVIRLLSDDTVRFEMSAQSIRFAHEKFDPNVRFNSFYESVLKLAKS